MGGLYYIIFFSLNDNKQICGWGFGLSLLHLGFLVGFLLVEFALLLGRGVLVLLVLTDQIVHVGDRRSTDRGIGGTWRDVANSRLHVVRDPFNKVTAVLVLGVEHLLVDLLHGHASSEHSGNSQVASVAWVAGGHHVLGVEHLLGEFGDGEGSVLLATSAGEWGKAWHEEVETGEGHHVDGELSEIGVQLTGESEARGDAAHRCADEMVQVTVGGGGELERSEANVVERLVVNAVGLVGVLDQLMDGERGVVRLDYGVADLGRWHYGEGVHNSVGVLLSDLGDEERAHAGTGAATEGVSQLKALKAIARLGLLSHNVQNTVYELGALGVVTLGPVVTGTTLAEDEVVRAEDLTERARSDGVHGTRLQVYEDGSWHVLAASGLVVVDVDSLELQIAVAMVRSGWVDSVLVGDDLPEFSADLVTALASLKMDNFSHFVFVVCGVCYNFNK